MKFPSLGPEPSASAVPPRPRNTVYYMKAQANCQYNISFFVFNLFTPQLKNLFTLQYLYR